ncbi:hypothetical protein C3489_07785, partial [Streptomyces sp. Ru71]|uniref:hypothetical protein n=1 Tax=Streptomyces sp. Ru71 TaxID=2080746 RepID=UPI000D47F982
GLLGAGAKEQVDALLTRNPAAHAPIDDPNAVARLLHGLLEAGAKEQVDALLARNPAAHAPIDDLHAVARLLRRLLQAGADEQAAAVTARLPAAGRFAEFIQFGDHKNRFRFGRDPDGSAAPSWAWGDLE